jgi:hypothetical protein
MDNVRNCDIYKKLNFVRCHMKHENILNNNHEYYLIFNIK